MLETKTQKINMGKHGYYQQDKMAVSCIKEDAAVTQMHQSG